MVLVLVHFALFFLGKSFFAEIALEGFELQVAPYVVLHIAENLRAVVALSADQNLVSAARARINKGAP